MVWPLALAVQGLTAEGLQERAEMLRTLLKMQCGNGLMHESGGLRCCRCRRMLQGVCMCCMSVWVLLHWSQVVPCASLLQYPWLT